MSGNPSEQGDSHTNESEPTGVTASVRKPVPVTEQEVLFSTAVAAWVARPKPRRWVAPIRLAVEKVRSLYGRERGTL